MDPEAIAEGMGEIREAVQEVKLGEYHQLRLNRSVSQAPAQGLVPDADGEPEAPRY